MRKYLFYGRLRYLLLFGLCGPALNAQVFFSVHPDYVRQKNVPFALLAPFVSQFPDTSIAQFHHYLPRNYLGNAGLPSPRYILDYTTDDLGFRFFVPPYSDDRFYVKNLPYRLTAGPYASITGVAGAKELQMVDAVFSQTYRSRLNLSLGFRRYTSLGFYRRQQTFTNNFYTTLNYRQPAGRFGFYAYFLNNSNRHNENGGISSGFLNDSTMLLDTELLNIRLSSASRDNRENLLRFSPWVRINAGDSSRKFESLLSLQSAYEGASFEYSDRAIAVDSFYQNTFLFHEATGDSAHVRRFTNELSVVLRKKKSGDGFSAGYRNELNRVWQENDSSLVNHILTGYMRWQLRNDSSGSVRLRASAQYVAAGSNVNNYLLEGSVTWGGKKRQDILAIDAAFESRDPDQIYRRWISNHFYWQRQHFRPQNSNRVRVRFSPAQGILTGIVGEQVTDFLYFGQDALPGQLAGSIVNARFFVGVSRVFWRHLGLRVNYDFQVTSAPHYVRLPAHHVQPGIFFEGFFFSNHLQLNLGLEADMFDRFLPYAYMPATQAFYLQQSVFTRPYPFTDVYLNIRIRPVSVFFRLENVLTGFAGPDYYLVPGYYQPAGALRFGLKWMFFD